MRAHRRRRTRRRAGAVCAIAVVYGEKNLPTRTPKTRAPARFGWRKSTRARASEIKGSGGCRRPRYHLGSGRVRFSSGPRASCPARDSRTTPRRSHPGDGGVVRGRGTKRNPRRASRTRYGRGGCTIVRTVVIYACGARSSGHAAYEYCIFDSGRPPTVPCIFIVSRCT